jgi:hypothetical protein
MAKTTKSKNTKPEAYLAVDKGNEGVEATNKVPDEVVMQGSVTQAAKRSATIDGSFTDESTATSVTPDKGVVSFSFQRSGRPKKAKTSSYDTVELCKLGIGIAVRGLLVVQAIYQVESRKKKQPFLNPIITELEKGAKEEDTEENIESDLQRALLEHDKNIAITPVSFRRLNSNEYHKTQNNGRSYTIKIFVIHFSNDPNLKEQKLIDQEADSVLEVVCELLTDFSKTPGLFQYSPPVFTAGRAPIFPRQGSMGYLADHLDLEDVFSLTTETWIDGFQNQEQIEQLADALFSRKELIYRKEKEQFVQRSIKLLKEHKDKFEK